VSSVYICCGTITIDGEISFIGGILKDVGIRHYLPNKDGAERQTISLSEERLADIDADILFISTYDKNSEKLLVNWQEKPLWKTLKAVQQKRVYLVNYSTWQGGNPIAANAVLDDLLKYLLEESKTLSGNA
jgi:iron complex transport system substrate-binding protein